ncbi:regulator of sigma E protease [Bartonella sp. CDC_skunk]|uniref:Uncharacterized protein n=1 Tax=Bartonella rochalimae ATCC BAA-1498 TaxID=685782 RepID=A0A067WLY7_9HYPH|nr:regulator of sigma E protease [Bartonella sp. CDC_skunk]AQX26494.1 regulator of sigma E protease [Bartonella sp. Raccoon60]KEC56942.1 hypothetical protein O99_00364 [Bartonella rochalimae ATCC BAA-1498]
MFYIAEAMTGKSVPAKIQEIVFRIGFFIVIVFMIFALFNDYFVGFAIIYGEYCIN